MKYRLRVRCEIQQTDDIGGYYGQGLNVEEYVDMEVSSFMELAAIIGHFHELSEVIREGQT